MTPASTSPMRCLLVGSDTLLVECGEILLAEGHIVVAVVAGSSTVANWATSKGFPVLDGSTSAGWVQQVADHSCDWLFAITHLSMIPPEVLAHPLRGAVNFHDGPLPGYSGLNAPAWALLAGEDEYGITWHHITAELDGGDVLSHVSFPIAVAETSLTLNTKNFAAAIESFLPLVQQLADGRTTGTPQSATATRRMFGRHDRPTAMGALDWRQGADQLARTVRALDFGPYRNPLATAVAVTNVGTLCVTAVEHSDESGVPGTVLRVDDQCIVVACGDQSLALSGFASPSGEALTAHDAASRHGLRTGSSLPTLDDRQLGSLTSLARRLSRSERFHVNREAASHPAQLPWPTAWPPGTGDDVVTLPLDFGGASASPSAADVIAALAVVLSRCSGVGRFDLGFADERLLAGLDDIETLFVSATVPLPLDVSTHSTFESLAEAVGREIAAIRQHEPPAHDIVARHPELRGRSGQAGAARYPVAVRLGQGEHSPGTQIDVVQRESNWMVRYDQRQVDDTDAASLAGALQQVIRAVAEDRLIGPADIELVGPDARRVLVDDWNTTERVVEGAATVHAQFQEQAMRSPDATAVVHRAQAVSFRELDERSNQLAAYLQRAGVGRDHLVGIHLERSVDLVVAVLAVLKAGGAYLPLDPLYPRDRLMQMVSDSGTRLIITLRADDRELPIAPGAGLDVLALDNARDEIDTLATSLSPRETIANDLAYCIYTSGSTGTPKGVLIEHANVVNFFTAMDDVVAHETPATWLSVTSLSFDISVLELLYTLTRGLTVVVQDEWNASVLADDERNQTTAMDFSLFYFSGNEAESTGAGKYRLLLEGAKWADSHGFCAVWTPERHFHAFGGLYAQPAITAAAVAAITTRVGIRAGSVVLPLHHSVRVAEEWSMVDNLSNGRVAIAFASGWQPNDFVLAPHNFAAAKSVLFEQVDEVKRLWRGEAVGFPGVDDTVVEVTTLPRPVQPELPVWITTAGNPETYEMAGRAGANVLTHLLGQSIDELATKIVSYRRARAAAGFDPDSGVVTLMLHTFVGTDLNEVRDTVREPLRQYLGTSLSLLRHYAGAFPVFRRPADADANWANDDFADLADDERDAVLDHAFQRYFESSGLFGTPQTCRSTVDRLKGIGVNEIACLIDFGVPTEAVLDSLTHLDELRITSNVGLQSERAPAYGFADQVLRWGASHLQCTPSMARVLLGSDADRAAMASLTHLYIGGEAFPPSLAAELAAAAPSATITNMYGPTETTIWSTTWPVQPDALFNAVPIGRPVANTGVYVLDDRLRLLPPGVPGALWIGGYGVARGYHARPDLTAERFVPDPFRGGAARMYCTGDIARWRNTLDGQFLEFLGRSDGQVKVRGHRIELGEVEAELGRIEGVRECAARVVTDSDDQILVAYIVAGDRPPDLHAAKRQLRTRLPEAMVPSQLVVLDEFPHTPNGKIDRANLPWPVDGATRNSPIPAQPAATDTERTLMQLWQQVLDVDDLGVDDNFFDVGGHSLLVVRLHRRVREVLSPEVSLTDLYRYPTIRSLAAALTQSEAPTGQHPGVDRASRRLDLQRRRSRS